MYPWWKWQNGCQVPEIAVMQFNVDCSVGADRMWTYDWNQNNTQMDRYEEKTFYGFLEQLI